MYLQKYGNLERKWNGGVNESILIVTHHLCELMDKLEMLKKRLLYVGIGAIIISIVFSIPNSFDIRTWIDTDADIFLIIIMAVGTLLIVDLSKKIQACIKEIKEIKDLLIRRINADFCQCSKPCNHKEKFMADVLGICKISLYYWKQRRRLLFPGSFSKSFCFSKFLAKFWKIVLFF